MALRSTPLTLPYLPQLSPVKNMGVTNITRFHYQLLDLLPKDFNQYLFGYASESQLAYSQATTVTNADSYREGMVMLVPANMAEIITSQVKLLLPNVLEALKMPFFVPNSVEASFTYYGDKCYYKIHNDNGTPAEANRTISYVYYMHALPKQFSGGQLKIGAELIEPINNSIVFFKSSLWHEVLPVSVLSNQFSSGRFTLNGWVRK